MNTLLHESSVDAFFDRMNTRIEVIIDVLSDFSTKSRFRTRASRLLNFNMIRTNKGFLDSSLSRMETLFSEDGVPLAQP